MMARTRKTEESYEERFQVPAERPEDTLDFRSDEQKAADEQIAKDYPEKTDDTREDASESALATDDPRLTGEPENTSDSSG
jgi:hypothetical protein